MNLNWLIIFIDSLPYRTVTKFKLFPYLGYKKALVPGFGYSANVHAEIFLGTKADEFGFFNEWQFNPGHNNLKKIYLPKIFLKQNSRLKMGDRLFHILLRKIFPRRFALNIPFKYQHWFCKKPSIFEMHKYNRFNNVHRPFFCNENITTIIGDLLNIEPYKRDYFAKQKAIDSINNNNTMFISLCDLDYFGHKFGVETRTYMKKVQDLNKIIAQLIDFWKRKKGEKCGILVFSDHGMANVQKSIKLEIEKKLGPSNLKTYSYFIDSTMVRIWLHKKSLANSMIKFFSDINEGIIISEEKRKKFGILNPKFGDIIFLLNEGHVFAPSFMGHNSPKAMHGYDPNITSQYGIVMSNISFHKIKKFDTIKLYNFLQSIT